MKIRSILFLIVAFAIPRAVLGQDAQVASVIHTRHKINSQILGEERTILVRVPAIYRQPETRFPVMYMLDAHPPQNAMMAGVVEQQAWGGVMPEMIIVGIQNTNRTRDLTPSKTARAQAGGGADKFLDFIEKEVIPLVDKTYRTHPFRVFAGHSYGGLFVVNALVTRPHLFNGYIAASPTLHFDNDLVIKRAEDAFKQSKALNKTLFASIGDEPDYAKGFASFQGLLKNSAPKHLEYELQVYKDENHGSIVLRSYFAGLRKIFSGWQPSAGTFAELEGHYRKLTERFGYGILIPEDIVNRAGYDLLNANRESEAIEVFKKNVANYPRSANTYDSLGEAYEKTGEIRLARENYKKAYDIAVAQDDAQLAAIYKANLDRVSKP